jgi:aspartyl-tRNA(Asn)/glutamyl-tRNA(Gln) amidotransferase subunit A
VSAVAEAFEQAKDVLRSIGAEVVESPWAEAASARAASFVINRVETVAVHERGLREHADRYAPEMRLRLEANALYPALGYLDAQRARQAVKRSMAALFAEHRLDALIAPTCPGVAAPADDLNVDYENGERESVHLAYTRLTMPFNATGQPVLSVPCGFDERGLPIGLQIAGRPFDEAGVCRIGHAYEQAAGWFERRPPMVERL